MRSHVAAGIAMFPFMPKTAASAASRSTLPTNDELISSLIRLWSARQKREPLTYTWNI
jgi:hypothetical protein